MLAFHLFRKCILEILSSQTLKNMDHVPIANYVLNPNFNTYFLLYAFHWNVVPQGGV